MRGTGFSRLAVSAFIVLSAVFCPIHPTRSDNRSDALFQKAQAGDYPAGSVSDAPLEWSACAADFNGDGDIDGADLALLTDGLQNGCADGADCVGDVDDNGHVDGLELSLLISGYGKADCPPAVPEDLEWGRQPDEMIGGAGLVADSVRIINGNAIEARTDIVFPSPNSFELKFAAVYNSRSHAAGALGFGWHHTYSPVLVPHVSFLGRDYLKIVDETGRGVYFREESTGLYRGAFNEKTRLERLTGGYVWRRLDGSLYGFSADGRLDWIEDEVGNRLDLAYDSGGRLATVTDSASGRTLSFSTTGDGLIGAVAGPVTGSVPDGVWVRFGYDEGRNLTRVDYADGSGIDYAYSDANDPNNLTAKRNRAGHLIHSWTYDDQDRCTSFFSREGKSVTIAYPDDAHAEVTDAYGVLRRYAMGHVDGRRRLSAMEGPALAPYSRHNAIRWEYDGLLNLTQVEYGGGSIHLFPEHDARGNPTLIVSAAGTPAERRVQYLFHPEMNSLLSRSEASVLGMGNKETVWDFDDDGDDIANEDPKRTIRRFIERGFTHDDNGAVVPYEYVTALTRNPVGQVTGIDGPGPGPGDWTTVAYDADTGDMTAIVYPLIGGTYFADYDAAGMPGTVTGVNGQSERYVYDGRGRTTTIIHDADGSAQSVLFNTAGLPYTRTDEDGVIREYEYDAAYGRLSRRFDMDDNFIAHTYDAQGRLIEKSKHNASGARTSYRRWSYQHPSFPGRIWKEIKADGTYTEYLYDDAGNVTSVKDPENHTYHHGYDAVGRLTSVVRPDQTAVRYDYDAHGNRISFTDGMGNVTAFIFDDLGRLVVNTSPDTGVTSYVYDESGNMTQKTDANGIVVRYQYDDLNRLTSVGFPDVAQNIGYAYDAGLYGVGRLTGIADESGSTTFEYDHRGRLVGKTSVLEGAAYALSRSYSPGGRLISMVYPSGRRIDHTLDPNGRTRSIATTYAEDTVNLVDNLAYQPFGRPQSLTTGSGGTVATQSGDCECMEISNPGTPFEQVYTYDANRNLLSISGTSAPWFNQEFTYDALNRLTGAVGPYGSYAYSYDGAGNRTARTMNDYTEEYSYVPGSNRLRAVTADAADANYVYDAAGNPTGIGSTTLVYNQSNRLIRVEENSTTTGEYVYNALGQRVIKTAGGTLTVFQYDFDGNVISEARTDGSIDRDYLYLGGSRTAMVDYVDGSFFYFMNDHLGTPLMVADATNTIVWEASYKPFGEAVVNPKSTVQNNFRFPGQYEDQETGLHYNYHRYYDPKIGRYLRADPIGLAGGMNLYAYGMGNPVNNFDIYGLEALSGGVDGGNDWI